MALPGAAAGQANTLSEIAVGDGAGVAARQVHAGGRRREPSRHLAGDARRRRATYRASSSPPAPGWCATASSPPSRARAPSSTSPGCFLGRGAEHIDTTLVVDHAVPGCESRELFKGVLADRARGVFQGKVIVRPDAQKTDGKQMAQVLMLSRGCRVQFQARAGDLRRRRGLRPRLDRGRDRRGPAVLSARARHPAGGGARAADRELRRRGARQGRGRAACARRLLAIAAAAGWPASRRNDASAARAARGGRT